MQRSVRLLDERGKRVLWFLYNMQSTVKVNNKSPRNRPSSQLTFWLAQAKSTNETNLLNNGSQYHDGEASSSKWNVFNQLHQYFSCYNTREVCREEGQNWPSDVSKQLPVQTPTQWFTAFPLYRYYYYWKYVVCISLQWKLELELPIWTLYYH